MSKLPVCQSCSTLHSFAESLYTMREEVIGTYHIGRTTPRAFDCPKPLRRYLCYTLLLNPVCSPVPNGLDYDGFAINQIDAAFIGVIYSRERTCRFLLCRCRGRQIHSFLTMVQVATDVGAVEPSLAKLAAASCGSVPFGLPKR